MALALPASSPLPPIAQTLAEAALQRQGSLLEPQGAAPPPPPLTGTAGQLAASWSAAAPMPLPTGAPAQNPVPPQAEAAYISARGREALGAGFDPRGAAMGARAGGLQGALLGGAALAAQRGLGAGGGARGVAGAWAALSGAAWPAAGLNIPQRQLVHALVAQLTAQVGPQRVVAAQAWPLPLAHALESGAEGSADAPLQTWLVRQGTVLTAEGLRGLAATLRVPTPWLASQAAQAASPAATGAGTLPPALQAPFTGPAQQLQSGVLALVLQGMGPAAVRTNALLVLDFQPQLATAGAAVYGRDMLQARLDPWLQLAQLQASGQLPRDEDLAREREAGLCQAPGCPYALRAPCAQPFCLEMRVGAPGASVAVLDAPSGRAAPDPAI